MRKLDVLGFEFFVLMCVIFVQLRAPTPDQTTPYPPEGITHGLSDGFEVWNCRSSSIMFLAVRAWLMQ